MRSRLMYWAGLNPHKIPVRDVLGFNDYVEDMTEEHRDLIKAGVGEAIAEAFDSM